MVGNAKILKALSEALRQEVKAILLYMVRSEWAAQTRRQFERKRPDAEAPALPALRPGRTVRKT